MADVVLTINGIGQGHLMRGLHLCRWLRRSGRRPLILHQGNYPAAYAQRYPGVSLPTVYRQAPHVKVKIQQQIIAAARSSTPSLVIEDTHPVELEFPPDVARLLIVRPTVMEHMRMLHLEYSAIYARFLICDHPDSPTWPYTAEETREILGWERFECLGPIFRGATANGTAAVRSRYRLTAEEPMLVFSLGGGGEKPESGDRERFLDWGVNVAKEYRRFKPTARFLFVCGPLFPQDLHIPTIFERIQQEPDFPSLLACANGAVIRPGYNAMWECIATQTPFFPLVGTTYMEPTDLRLRAMACAGIVLPTSPAELASDEARKLFAAACRGIISRFSGSPRKQFLKVVEDVAGIIRREHMCLHQERIQAINAVSLLAGKNRLSSKLVLQLEGKTDHPQNLAWLVEQMHHRPISISLAMIPYLTRLSSATLDEIDPHNMLSVSMHGFSDLQRDAGAEFTEAGKNEEIQRRQLRLGFRLMRWLYRGRFRGGLVAPSHALPEWAVAQWGSMGGAYVAEGVHTTRRHSYGLPVIAMVSVMDFQDLTRMGTDVRAFLQQGRHAGISLNLHLLNTEASRSALLTFVDSMAAFSLA